MNARVSWAKALWAVTAMVLAISLASSARAGTIGPLTAVSGEVGYSNAASGWNTDALTASQLSGLTSGSSGVEVVSSIWNPRPDDWPNYGEVYSPAVVLWFDASQLVAGATVTLDLSASASLHCPGFINNTIHCQVYGQAYVAGSGFVWGWLDSDTSWDSAVSSLATFTFSRAGYGYPPVYYVTDSVLIGVRLAEYGTLSGGIGGTGAYSVLDVSQIAMTGELVPEPATLSLLTLGGLAVLLRRERR